MMAVPVRRAGGTDVDAVAAVIADAFQYLAVAAWLVAERTHRASVLHQVFRIHVEYAVTHGCVWTTGEHTGVAVWLPRVGPPEPIPDYDRRLAVATGGYVDRFRELDRAFDTRHPEQPHQHLAFLAVLPERHRAGLGSALLAWQHRELDRTGTAAYLEASSTDSRRLYLRHGYRDRHPPIDLPDGPRLWPMWREPRKPTWREPQAQP
jgi:GNAT superfamily N-acetyltransferase